jgi:hypothetical protein
VISDISFKKTKWDENEKSIEKKRDGTRREE